MILAAFYNRRQSLNSRLVSGTIFQNNLHTFVDSQVKFNLLARCPLFIFLRGGAVKIIQLFSRQSLNLAPCVCSPHSLGSLDQIDSKPTSAGHFLHFLAVQWVFQVIRTCSNFFSCDTKNI